MVSAVIFSKKLRLAKYLFVPLKGLMYKLYCDLPQTLPFFGFIFSPERYDATKVHYIPAMLSYVVDNNPHLQSACCSSLREEPLMIWGGAWATAGKKTQRVFAQGKKKVNG